MDGFEDISEENKALALSVRENIERAYVVALNRLLGKLPREEASGLFVAIASRQTIDAVEAVAKASGFPPGALRREVADLIAKGGPTGEEPMPTEREKRLGIYLGKLCLDVGETTEVAKAISIAVIETLMALRTSAPSESPQG